MNYLFSFFILPNIFVCPCNLLKVLLQVYTIFNLFHSGQTLILWQTLNLNKKVTAVGHKRFSVKHILTRCPNSFSTTCVIVMKLNWVFNCHIWMCILSGIYVWTKIVKMMIFGTNAFFSKTWSNTLSTTAFNTLQDCNGTQWSVRSPYGDVYIVKN